MSAHAQHSIHKDEKRVREKERQRANVSANTGEYVYYPGMNGGEK